MRSLIALVFLACLLLPASAWANVCRVATTGSVANDGSSWDQATRLQAALYTGTCTEIWVAGGVYRPSSNDPSVSFNIRFHLKIYGGFAGTETSRDQRDPKINPTVLSGDIGNDDCGGSGCPGGIDIDSSQIAGTNSYHVVMMGYKGLVFGSPGSPALDSDTVVDGFVITAGSASGSSELDLRGGGLICDSQSITSYLCSPTLTNLWFSGNRANLYGGGMENNAGGLDIVPGDNEPILTNVTFSGNHAVSGGALHNNGMNTSVCAPTLTSVTFSNNSANIYGGAIYNEACVPELTDVTFNGNSAGSAGGAMQTLYNESVPVQYGTPSLYNVILWGDSAPSGPETAGIATTYLAVIQGGCPASANCTYTFTGDPKLQALSWGGGFTPTMDIGAGSSAIDQGFCYSANSHVPVTDQRGVAKPQGAGCDLGAVEAWTGACHVDVNAHGSDNGSSWIDAYRDLQFALHDPACSEIWVAAGVYHPSSSDAAVSYVIPPGVSVYGGFAGTETLRTQRDPLANPTVLSGDLADDDCGGGGCPGGIDSNVAQIAGTNSRHVVLMDGTTNAGKVKSTTTLDGVVITAGDANGAGYPDSAGGGILCNGAGTNNGCNPTLSNLMFSANRAAGNGGAISVNGSSAGAGNPTLVGDTFYGNVAGSQGGALHLNGTFGGASNPTLTNVTFASNSASIGGAISSNGGNGTSSPQLTNVTFIANTATGVGGAMYNDGSNGGSSSPALINVILWLNTVNGNNQSMFNAVATPSIDHSVVQGGCPSGATCTNLVTTNPGLGALADHGGFTQTMLPGAGSPAIDAGVCHGAVSAVPTVDQRGVARPQGGGCDIGATEVVEYPLNVTVSTAGGSVDTTSPAKNSTQVSACTKSGGVCHAWYSAEAASPISVTLTATPVAGRHVVAWGGDCASGGSGLTASVSMSAARNCTIGFAIDTFAITTSVSPVASGTLTCTPNPVNYGSSSTCTATPATGYVFASWSGDCTGSGSCQLTNVTSAKSVTANFAVQTFAITTAASPAAGGSVACAPNPVSYGAGSACTATANPGYTFVSWSGDCAGTIATCNLTNVTANKSVTASFTGPPIGVTVDDGSPYAAYGDVVTYTVTVANSGGMAINGIAVSGLFSAAFDLQSVQWLCAASNGASCAASGSGGLADTVDLPAQGSVSYTVMVLVRPDATDTNAVLIVTATGASAANDTDALVIFEGGFEAPVALAAPPFGATGGR